MLKHAPHTVQIFTLINQFFVALVIIDELAQNSSVLNRQLISQYLCLITYELCSFLEDDLLNLLLVAEVLPQFA